LIDKKKLENADVVVTEAESAVEFIKNKYKISPKRIIAKPLGIQIPSKNFSNMDLNFKENVLNLGYVGTFASYHNVELLQPVFKYFKNKKIIFYLIGSGGNIKKIKNWVEDNEIVNVIFTGYLENEKLIQYLNFLDIGIVPNCEKHMAPIKTFEYGVYNICPMVPEYDAFSKIIKNKENGIIFKPNSPDSIIKNIDDVLKGDIEYKQCGSNWNKFVLNTFQWHQVVRNVLFEAEKL
jgi:glycosyltransferase involved in cell wall biosynthesis